MDHPQASATLYRIDGGGTYPVRDLRGSLVEIGEVGGDPYKVIEAAGEAGAEALVCEPLTSYVRGAKPGERLLYVRSPATGFWYEHLHPQDPHPFIEWRTKPGAREGREPIFAGVFYALADNLCGRGPDEPQEVREKAIWCLSRALAYEKRDLVERMLRKRVIHKTFGLEARLGELIEGLRDEQPSASGVLRVQVPAPCFGESVAVFMVGEGEVSGRHPYLAGAGTNVGATIEKLLEEFSVRSEP